MRLRLGDISAAQADPEGFVRQLLTPGANTGFKSKRNVFQLAVHHYHKNREDLHSARRHLTNLFERQFSQASDLAEWLLSLDQYSDAYQASRFVNAASRSNIRIAQGDDHLLTGRIPRIDLRLSGGYSILAGFQEGDVWRSELRTAILQAYFAREFTVNASEIQVGVYQISSGDHQFVSLSEADLIAARGKVADILSTVQRLMTELRPKS